MKEIEKKIVEYQEVKQKLNDHKNNGSVHEIKLLEQKLEDIKHDFCSNLSPWQRVQICRHNERPSLQTKVL